MMLKKKRKWVWCSQVPVQISTFVERPKVDMVPKGLKNRIKHKLPSRVKCPDCGKRFKPRVRECSDWYCWHVYLPAHKKLV